MRSFNANEPKTVFGSTPTLETSAMEPFFPFFAETAAVGLIIFTLIFFAGGFSFAAEAGFSFAAEAGFSFASEAGFSFASEAGFSLVGSSSTDFSTSSRGSFRGYSRVSSSEITSSTYSSDGISFSFFSFSFSICSDDPIFLSISLGFEVPKVKLIFLS